MLASEKQELTLQHG